MTIEFLTQQDPIYILPLFEEFIRNYSEQATIVRISCCKTMGTRPRRQLVRELVHLYGALGFARLAGRILVSHLLGWIPLGRGAKRYFSLSQLCRAYGIEYGAISNPNGEEFVADVLKRQCDLIVSIACPFILKSQLLSTPPLGCINIHHAPLPRYKGMMPTFWQLYQGERSVGLTVHYMTEKLDDGDALLQEHLAVEEGESLDHLIRRSKRHAAHCLAKVIHQIRTNSASLRPLKHKPGSYFTFPTLAEIREFRRRGLNAI
jgi:methionyl-tRNA formyltransferase